MRRTCLSIGVSRAEGLAPLRAAAIAAEEIGRWAELSGFARREDIRVLTDRQQPVTVELIAQRLRELLPIGVQTDTLILHFAGHGMREDNTRTLWLPTNWRTELRAIAVERLKNRLSDFGIANVTIISDACKALANDKDTSDLTADGVLGAGTSAGIRPIFDRFDAVHDVQAAFMIPGPTPAESRCLFSGALIEALWGTEQALDQHHPGMVTPGSLADFLTTRVAELCQQYGLKCEPETLPGRPANHLIYFDRSMVAESAIPTLPPWPRPYISISQEGPMVEEITLEPREPNPKPSDGGDFGGESGTSSESVRNILGDVLGSTNPDITRHERRLDLPLDARTKLDWWSGTFDRFSREGPGALSNEERSWLEVTARGEVERAVVNNAKGLRRARTVAALTIVELPKPGEANLLLRGGAAAAIWSCGAAQAVADGSWLIHDHSGGATQLVVEYADEIFVPLTVYPDLVTIAARDDRGPMGWLFQSPYEQVQVTRDAAETLASMQAGTLAPSEVDAVASQLRAGKHGNPTLGAVCAYLYDYIGDLDNIRRMAGFYVTHGQPIPYDIALMGELESTFDPFGYRANVPAVAEAADIDRARPAYVTWATEAVSGTIGGLCPWLRQGWDFVETPTDREVPLVQGLPDVRKHLLPETFTCFNRAGGQILVNHWGMRRSS